MKSRILPQCLLAGVSSSLLVLSAPTSLRAATYSWDPGLTPVTPSGGAGTWNTSNAFWSNGSVDSAWTDTTGTVDNAIFGGTADAVAVGTALGAKGLGFTTTGYTLSGSALTIGSDGIDASSLSTGTTTIGNAITTAASQTWTVGAGSTLLLNSTVTSAASSTQTLTIAGAGNTTITGLINDGTSATLNLIKTGAGYLSIASTSATDISGSLDIQGGTVGVAADFTAVGLTGTGTFENNTNNDKWTFWNIATDQTFDGVFRNNNGTNTGLIGFVKNGTGTLTLTNNSNVISSNFQVNAGKVILNNTGTYGGSFQGGSTRTNLTALIGNTAAANGVLVNNGATLNYNNRSNSGTEPWRGTLAIGNNATGAGSLTMTSGSLTTNKQLGIGVASGSYGAMTQTGGSTTVGGFLAISLGGAATRGVLNVSGGSFTQNGPVTIGANGIGVANFSGTSTFSQSTNSGFSFYVGEAASSVGILNVSGNASLNVIPTTGVVVASNATATGTVNLLGGTLQTYALSKGSGTGTVNFNGGTLKANVANASFFTGLTNTYIQSGGGTIDNGGFAITVGQALLAPTGNGVSATGLSVSGGGYINTPVVTISGGGGSGATAVATIDASGNLTGITITNPGVGYTSTPTFTLSGGGIGNTGAISGTATLVTNTSGGMTFSGSATTTLTGASTYTGATTISNGRLALSSAGTLASTSINVSSGAVFDVTAKSGGYSLSGINLTIGSNGTTSGLLDGGSVALTLGGNLVINFTSALAGTSFNLLDYGSYSGNFSSVSLTGSVLGTLSLTSADTWTGSFGGNNYSFSQTNGVLSVTAVPEPHEYALALSGLLLAVVVLRRRRMAV